MTVHLTALPESPRFQIENPTDDLDNLLREELSYEYPDAEYTPSYKCGDWDGTKSLYSTNTHTAPVGLLDHAETVLEANGYAVTVHRRETPLTAVSYSWGFEYDLRDYQRDAVDAVRRDGGGIVSIPTGGGKTVVGLKAIEEIGARAIVFVHTKELLHQWRDRISRYLDVEPGVIGDGEWREGPVTVAMMQTLTSRGTDDLQDYGVAVFDECHRTSAADTMHEAGQAVNAGLRIGLSATPWRSVEGEELKIEGAVGGVTAQITASELIEKGYLARPEFELIDPTEHGAPSTGNPSEEYHQVYEQCIVNDSTRTRAVVGKVRELARAGRSVLVSVDRIAHGQLLAERLSDRAVFLSGEDSTQRRQDTIQRFTDGEIDILVSTLLREGVDIPDINAVVLAEGGKSDIAKIQTIGRALRPANGENAVIADVRDRGPYLGEHFECRQDAFAEYYGEYGPTRGRSDVVAVREWLDSQGIPLDELAIFDDGTGSVRVEITGWIDEFDHYRTVMASIPGASFHGDHYQIPDPERLNETTPARVV